MKNLKILFILLFFVLINNCTSIDQAMSGKTGKNTDEFLVKKKDPLVLPPKYEELPLPKSKQESEKTSVEKMLKSSGEIKDDPRSISALENMILKELGKNN
tara:strand:- start:286 stop:588 length:303 start_codon:yes stop_codon:yes gene_type:complete